jgi:hypothetical protein
MTKYNSHKARTQNTHNRTQLATRLGLIERSIEQILRVYVEAGTRGVTDPLVIVTDDRKSDPLVTMLGLGTGTRVGLVSASEFVSRFGSLVAETIEVALRGLRPGGLFVLCLADGGATGGYVNYNMLTGELKLSTTPGASVSDVHQGSC